MSKIFKVTTLLSAILILSPTFANYRMTVPLETSLGGRLPDGSINFGQKEDADNTETDPPSSNCIYNSGTYVYYQTVDEDGFKVGDQYYWYNNQVIAWYSPSNGYTLPAGLSLGTKQPSNPEYPDEVLYSLCADHPESYPPMVFPEPPSEPNDPVDDHTGPDWTPECILNTNSDYAAINTTNGTRIFNSVTFGLTNYTPQRWFYVPADYDPDNPSSYIYFDKQESDGGSRVTGPNPDYTYAPLCRVRKMEL